MTWPVPDRPNLPRAPSREERRRARQAELDAIEAAHPEDLPPGIRRRDDGAWFVPYWRRDELWIIGGVVLAMVLLVGFFAYFTATPSADDVTPPLYIDHGPITPFWWGVGFVVIVSVVVGSIWVLWQLIRQFRQRGTRYEDVSPEEQARRREVARLLKQVEPPVSADDAERQLGHVDPT